MVAEQPEPPWKAGEEGGMLGPSLGYQLEPSKFYLPDLFHIYLAGVGQDFLCQCTDIYGACVFLRLSRMQCLGRPTGTYDTQLPCVAQRAQDPSACGKPYKGEARLCKCHRLLPDRHMEQVCRHDVYHEIHSVCLRSATLHSVREILMQCCSTFIEHPMPLEGLQVASTRLVFGSCLHRIQE